MNVDIYTVDEAVVIEIFCPIKCISFTKILVSLALASIFKKTINPDDKDLDDRDYEPLGLWLERLADFHRTWHILLLYIVSSCYDQGNEHHY